MPKPRTDDQAPLPRRGRPHDRLRARRHPWLGDRPVSPLPIRGVGRSCAFAMILFSLLVPSLVEAQQTFTPGRHGRFDAEFDQAECKLTVTVRVVFEFLKGPHRGEVWQNEAEKTQWKDNFKQEVKDHWSGRFEFAPVNPRQIPCERVTVEINIEEPTDPRQRHFKIKVKKTNSHKKSSVGKGVAKLDSKDTEERTKGGRKQHGAFHEFGHMLGLPDETGSITSSQMSDGDTLVPSHYSTLEGALETLTGVPFNTVSP